jgi:hypothetical protein
MKRLARSLHQKLGDFWWYSLMIFCACRAADLLNAFVGLWLVPKYIGPSELGAVALQTFLCGLLGAAGAGGSVVWETDWGILRQTGTNFLILAGAMLPIAYVTGWMEHSVKGFLLYFAAFTLIFALIWLVQYLALKRRVKKLNEKVQGM